MTPPAGLVAALKRQLMTRSAVPVLSSGSGLPAGLGTGPGC